MKITIDQFHGEAPKIAPHLLSPQQATDTRNCDLRSGNLKALKMPAKADSTGGGIKPKTIYLFNSQGDNPVWFESEQELDILRGPIPNDTEESTYITGGKKADGTIMPPRMTYSSIATSGTPPYPSVTRRLGVPAPESPPLVALNPGSVDEDATGFAADIEMNDGGGIESVTLISGGSGYTGALNVVVEDQVPETVQNVCTVDGVVRAGIYTAEICAAIAGVEHDWKIGIELTIDSGGVITSAEIPESTDVSGFKEGRTTLALIDPYSWGSGAELKLAWTDGVVTGIDVVKGGVNYPSGTMVNIRATRGAGAKVKALAVDGVIQPLIIESKGAGYFNPRIIITSSKSTVETNALPITRAYVYTYVTSKGEEGPPSMPSDLFDWMSGQSVDVVLTDATITGEGYDVERLRVYRYAQGASSGDYFYVGEVTAGTKVFTDDILDSDLPGGMLATTDFDPPPEDMLGLVSLTNGVMAGFSGREICFCEPYLPYAWPVKYRMMVDYDIVGLGSLGNGVVVLTTGQPYLIMGSHPEVMGMDKLDIPQSCISKRSIVSFGGAVAFASPDGLYMISQNGSQNLTRDLMTREQWQRLAPASMLGVYDEGRYLGFFNSSDGKGSFALDSTNPNATYTKSSVFADAVFRDLITDQIYIVDNEDGVWTDMNDVPLWRSKEFLLPHPANLSAMRILGDGDVGVSIYADGDEVFGKKVKTGHVVRLPSGFLARRWVVELSGFDVVDRVDVSSSVAEIANGQ